MVDHPTCYRLFSQLNLPIAPAILLSPNPPVSRVRPQNARNQRIVNGKLNVYDFGELPSRQENSDVAADVLTSHQPPNIVVNGPEKKSVQVYGICTKSTTRILEK